MSKELVSLLLAFLFVLGFVIGEPSDVDGSDIDPPTADVGAQIEPGG